MQVADRLNSLRSYFMFSKALDREYSPVRPESEEKFNQDPSGGDELL